MENTALRYTPLLNQHRDLKARLAPFGNWLMPIQYEGIIAEHNWTRGSASLFDICHMGEFLIHANPDSLGQEATFTFRPSSMPIGGCKYGFMLNEKGGIIDDLIAYRLDEDKWMMVVNAATRDKDLAHINNSLSGYAVIEDISDKTAKLDLQGPVSRDVLVSITQEAAGRLEYYKSGMFKILGRDSIISRTGYTGELGFEIYLDVSYAAEAWVRMLEDKRVRPAGLGARDTLRLEMAYPLYGQDISDKITPLEAGMGCFVDFEKDFIGKAALMKQKEHGLDRKLILFISETRRSPRHGDRIYSGEREIGTVTSGSFSPSLGFGIGMGYIDNGYDWIGGYIIIKNERSGLSALITDKPFYRTGGLRG
jgi:aminomethyltransferase